jgi:UDP-N-acetylglucosamine acyltransferase
MGGLSGVHQFCRVGRLAMVGGAGAASQDIPPFCTTRSSGLNALAGLNMVGLRRAGVSPGQRQALKAAYKKLFLGRLNMTEALKVVRAEHDEDVVRELCDFIETTERGVCRPRPVEG